MNNTEFVNKLLEVRKYNTYYAKGTFGQKATNGFIDSKQRQYPSWYTTARVAKLKSLSDDTRLFDCCGLGKAILWGFPNVVYTSNGVPDLSDDTMWKACVDQSKDFSKIEIGEVLWIKGHVGFYIGSGKAIECTNAWNSNVQVTAVENIGKISGLHSRKWTAHGKLKYIDYGSATPDNPKPNYSNYPILKQGSTGEYVRILQQLLLSHGCDPKGIDGQFGPNTKSAVMKYQKNNTDVNGKKLAVDGCVGPLTWGSLYK